MKFKLFFISMLILVETLWSSPCSFSWTPSHNKTPFKNIDNNGNVLIKVPISNEILSNGNQFDLVANFQSNRVTESKIFGYKWFVNLLDPNVLKTEKNKLIVTFPNSDTSEFILYNPHNKIYKGLGWIAQIKGGQTDIAKECGTNIVFKSDRLEKVLSPNQPVIYFKYANDKLESISEGRRILYTFKYDDKNSTISIVDSSKKTIKIHLSEIFITDSIQAKLPTKINSPKNGDILINYDLVDNTYQSIEIIQAEGISRSIDKYTWNAHDGSIVRQTSIANDKLLEDWKYTVNKSKLGENAKIARDCVLTGLNEIWKYGRTYGTSIVKLKDYPLKETNHVLINGKRLPRTEKTTSSDGKEEYIQYLYDGKGRLLRKVINNRVIDSYIYHDKENSIEKRNEAGELEWIRIFDKIGNIVKIQYPDRSLKFKYFSDDRVEATLTKQGKSVTRLFNKNNLNTIN